MTYFLHRSFVIRAFKVLAAILLMAVVFHSVTLRAEEEVLDEEIVLSEAEEENDPESQESIKDKLELFFASRLLPAIKAVVFFDVIFWDNWLPDKVIPNRPISLPVDWGQQLQMAKEQYKAGEIDDVEYSDIREKALRNDAIVIQVLSYSDADNGFVTGEYIEADTMAVLPLMSEPLQKKSKYVNWTVDVFEDQVVAIVSKQMVSGIDDLPLTPIEQWNARGYGKVPKIEDGKQRFVTTALTDSMTPLVLENATGDQSGDYTVLETKIPLPYDFVSLETAKDVLYKDRRLKVISLEEDVVKAYDSETSIYPVNRLSNPHDIKAPLVVVWLMLGALFFTFRLGFLNISGFRRGLQLLRRKRDDADPKKETLTAYQALSMSMGGTIGLGNIAGVIAAVGIGGAGSVLWMAVAGILSASTQFAEAVLGRLYYREDEAGVLPTGGVSYLRHGLADINYPRLGRVLAAVFAIMCLGGSLGGGNLFQSKQVYTQMSDLMSGFSPKAEGTAVFKVHRLAHFENDLLPKPVRKAMESDVVVPQNTLLYSKGQMGNFTFQTLDRIVIPKNKQKGQVKVRALSADPKANLFPNTLTGIQSFAFGTMDKHEKGIEKGLRGMELNGLITVSNPHEFTGGRGDKGFIFGILLAFAVGIVIFGGFVSIGKAASVIVPLMVTMYFLCSACILLNNIDAIPGAVQTMFDNAFSMDSALGGFVGALIAGFQRACFSNEVGIGSSSIAHSLAEKVDPVEQGFISILGPYIDTVLVCSLTGLVIMTSGVDGHPDLNGIALLSLAYESFNPIFPYLLTMMVFFFAFTTMICWSYYGENATIYLFGKNFGIMYKLIFLTCVVMGASVDYDNVIAFSEIMILGMAFPNLCGVLMLQGKIRVALDDYWVKVEDEWVETQERLEAARLASVAEQNSPSEEDSDSDEMLFASSTRSEE